MNTGYIWFQDQWKYALLVSEGRKWNHYVVLTEYGVRKIKQPNDTTMKSGDDSQVTLLTTITGLNRAGGVLGMTKAAEASLLEAEASAKELADEEEVEAT